MLCWPNIVPGFYTNCWKSTKNTVGVQLIELNRLRIPYIKVLKLKAVLLLKKKLPHNYIHLFLDI